jgi:hypothetical protein
VARLLGHLLGDINGDEDEAAVRELRGAAQRAGTVDIREYAARIRHGLRSDPGLAVGSSKDLLEAVLKGIIGPDKVPARGRRPTVPDLARMANDKLRLAPSDGLPVALGENQRAQVLQALSSIVNAVAAARNQGGAGHGVTSRPHVDEPTARLVVHAAIAAATFYIEAQTTTEGSG